MSDHRSNKAVRNIVLSIVTILIVLIVVLGFTAYRFYNNALEPLDAESDEEIQIEIPQGSSRMDIARNLEENEVISSAFVFNYYVRFNEEQGFLAGAYTMSPAMDINEIIELLQAGGSPITEEPIAYITIPEGSMLEEVAGIIEDNTEFSAEEFMETVENESFLNELSGDYSTLLEGTLETEDTRYTLEGYLYPATYEFYEGDTLEGTIRKMVDRMNQAANPYFEDINASDYTLHEILTLASFIEREGFEADDRFLFSGVFHNRLDVGMPLQTDVSVIYAHGEHRLRVTYEDLEIDSPYNTYMYTGLGPGPVNMPSESSIEAAVRPEETDYMYFLADLDTREVYFSETYEQHLEYQNEYLR